MSNLERQVTRIAVFLGGAMLMAAEISAFRIVGKTFGSALRETTAVIAVFLAAMSIGYWAGGRAGDRWPRMSTLITSLLFAALSLLTVPWLDSLISPRIASSAIAIGFHAFLASAILFAIPTAFFASVSPIAIRLFATTASESGATAGSISAISTVGSIAGSVATAFFLLEWLESITRTVIFVSLAACATAALLLLASLPRVAREEAGRTAMRRYALAGTCAVALVAVPTAVFMQSAKIDAALLRTGGGWKDLFVGDSAYHHIAVREKGRVRMLSFGLGAQSMMDTSDPNGHGLSYTDSYHIARFIRPDVHRVLNIGLGGGTSAKQFTTYYDDVELDAVDVDPMVVRVAQTYFFVHPSNRLRLHVADGRTFLRQTNEKWDLIIVDAYTTNRYGATIPPHLVTREFLSEAAAHLNPGGILHFHCAFGSSRLFPALQKTMSTVFSSTLVTKGEILGSNMPIIVSNDVIAERARHTRAASLPDLSNYIAALQPPTAQSMNGPLLTDDYAPVDTLVAQR